MTFPTDLQIARTAHPKPLSEIAHKMGIGEHLLEPYGSDVAKIRLDAIEELSDRPKAKYVVVTAITPTPLGEGKTTTAVGLGQAMQCVGKNAVLTLRQPSMGPTFGIKGGAAGGGEKLDPVEVVEAADGLEAKDGRLRVALPEFGNDVAMKLRRAKLLTAENAPSAPITVIDGWQPGAIGVTRPSPFTPKAGSSQRRNDRCSSIWPGMIVS